MASTSKPVEFYKDQFMISTSKSLLQHDVINEAFASGLMSWTKRMPEEALKKMLSNSLCFGVYILPGSSSEIAGRQGPAQIGLARLVTDEVTFAWITDVYILPKYQSKGLGKWLMECVNGTLDSWSDLKRAMLMGDGEVGKKFYKKALGMDPFIQDPAKYSILQRRGPGVVLDQ